MGKRIVLDLSWLIGLPLRPSHLQTVFTETFHNGYDTCYVHIQRDNSKLNSNILMVYELELLSIALNSYAFNGFVCISTGIIYTIYIDFTFRTITTISDIVDFVICPTCYRFHPKRNEEYEILKIDKPGTVFNIENLWKH